MDARRFALVFGLLWTALFSVSMAFRRPEFRPWEMLYDPASHRFLPDRRVTMDAVGDLGHMSWIRTLQIERRVTFSTDQWGLRNPPGLESPRIVVLGDSFVVGSGSSDDETLTESMGAELEEPVYNFGVETIDSPALFLRDSRFASRPPQIVIWAPVARRIRPRPLFIPEPPVEQGLFAKAAALDPAIGDALDTAATRLDRDNGLAYHVRYLYNGLLYRLRGYEHLIHPDGRPALALSVSAQGLADTPQERDVDTTIEMVHTFARFLADHRVDFVYCPIPESATIYPELFPDRDQIVSPSFLDLLIEGVRRRGVEVVDLRPPFRAHKEPYLYLRDDSHWAPRAIVVAARALSREVRDLDERRARRVAAGGAPRTP